MNAIHGCRARTIMAHVRGLVIALLLALAVVDATAAIDPPDASLRPGVLRVAAHSALRDLLDAWADAYAKRAAGEHIEAAPVGSDVAMAALYTACADIAVLGRGATDSEIKAFEWIYRYKPMRIEIGTGSVATAGSSPALAVLVHKDNPLTSITLAQLDAAFGSERRRGGAPVLRWGQLGLRGALAEQPIELYAPDAESGTGRFFRNVVLLDSNRMNWDTLTEYAPERTGRAQSGSKQVVEALADNPRGLAVADAAFVDARVRMVALGPSTDVPARRLDRATVAARSYALARPLYAYVNRAPGAKLELRLQAFLAWILSPEGQQLIARRSAYLPLTAAARETQRAALDQELP
ncbi:MAG: substrate-binding domain-containing protein [Steroidobacteraceae bacterium]